MPSSTPSIFLGCKNTNARVLHLAHNALRITHVSKENPTYPADRPWVKDILIGGETKTSNYEDWDVRAEEGCLSINNLQDYFTFRELETSILSKRKKTGLSIVIEKDEVFYGFGERFDAFGRTSGKLSMVNQESPAFLQNHRTYSNIPVFLSSRGYLFFSLTSRPGKWKIDHRRGKLSINTPGSEIDYVLIFGKDFKEILSTYTGLTGRPPLVPRWAFGLWVTSFPQEDQTRTITFLKEHRKRHIPLDAIILDYHWEEKFHNFKWRKKLFPSPDIFIKNLKALGIHLGLILTPFVNNKNNYPLKIFRILFDKAISKSTLWDDERALEEYSDGKRKGVFAHPNAAWWFGKGGMLDFTNPDSRKWWGKKLISLYRKGVDFFKNDDGEYLPPGSTSAMGLDSQEYHNLYGFYYGKTMYEQQLELSPRRPMIYARSVWSGSQRYPAMFLGDQIPGFKNIQRSINAGLNMSLLGFSYWTADCFGLNGKTNPEIHMRYAQWALMVPIARYFVRPEKTDDTRFPWSHSLEVENNFRKYISLRYRLLPYYVNLAWQSWLFGWPIMRPMVFEYPKDTIMNAIKDQIFLGDQLLLAPVLKKVRFLEKYISQRANGLIFGRINITKEANGLKRMLPSTLCRYSSKLAQSYQ